MCIPTVYSGYAGDLLGAYWGYTGSILGVYQGIPGVDIPGELYVYSGYTGGIPGSYLGCTGGVPLASALKKSIISLS